MLRLVLDTNVLISAFFWEGNEADLFRRIEQGKANLFVSSEILKEIGDVLNKIKFKEVLIKSDINKDQIIQKIILVLHMVIGNKLNIDVCRDKEDNKFLECAEHAKADYIISGDEDLLILKKYKNIRIITSSEILKLI